MDSQDKIPLEGSFAFHGAENNGPCTAQFYAFNTVITLQGFAPDDVAHCAFEAARDRCRSFERAFSRTLPHSDISRLNNAQGAWVDVGQDTYNLLQASLRYCEESEGIFDITMGSAVRLWDFHAGRIPDGDMLREALRHVNWRVVELRCERNGDVGCTRYLARLSDPDAFVDVGGTAKGYIADALGALLANYGMDSFIVNLGGNVLTHGRKPDGSAWNVGIQDPRVPRDGKPQSVLSTIALTNASAVTSGVYERSFERNGVTYHHILDPKTGYPVQTDLAGATVVAQASLDAEGYSTTILALGSERAARFVREHSAIIMAALVFPDGRLQVVTSDSNRATN